LQTLKSLMSTLKEKSDMNIQAALVLTSTENVCLSSVHCAYYSCYQLVIYFLETKLNLDNVMRKKRYDQYVDGVRDAGGTKILGSHEYWIQQFINDYRSRCSGDVPYLFKNLVLLRQARLESDYETTDFNKRKTDDLYDLALDVRKKMIKTYGQ
jgi:hypothetical protein